MNGADQLHEKRKTFLLKLNLSPTDNMIDPELLKSISKMKN